MRSTKHTRTPIVVQATAKQVQHHREQNFDWHVQMHTPRICASVQMKIKRKTVYSVAQIVIHSTITIAKMSIRKKAM